MAPEANLGANVRKALDLLQSSNVIFEDGLSDSEIERVETRFEFQFPIDLKAFLQAALPVGIRSEWGKDAFPNWRSGDHDDLQRRLDWPFEGIAFDIENNVFWMDAWGTKPNKIEDAIEIARLAIKTAPRLIPVCSHRYLPAEPLHVGNPVFSAYQTDIIFYGCDLWDYFANEFGPQEERWQRFRGMSEDEIAAAYRTIRFWSSFTQ